MLFRFRLNLDNSVRLHESESRETARAELHAKYGKTLNHAALELARLSDLKAGDRFKFVGTNAVYVVTAKNHPTELFYRAEVFKNGTIYSATNGQAKFTKSVIKL